MSDKPNKVKRHKKDSQLLIRISSTEREQFLQLCEELDTSAAREIRQFIRAFIKRNTPGESRTKGDNRCPRKTSPPKGDLLKQEIKKRKAKIERHEKKIKVLKKAAKKAACFNEGRHLAAFAILPSPIWPDCAACRYRNP